MRRIRSMLEPRPDGGSILSMLLIATLLAPLAGATWGARLDPPFGVSRGTLAFVAAAAAVLHVLTGMRRAGGDGVGGPLARVALTSLLALGLERLITLRASGFYTENALFEGVTVLLGLHVLGSALQRAGRWRSPEHARAVRHGLLRRLRRDPDAVPVTAAAFADFVTDGIALLVVAFWVLTAFNARDVAFALMLVAGGSQLLVLVLRLPDALRALERWVKPATALALVAALHACATSALAEARGPRPRYEASGPGCGVAPADTAPPSMPRRVRLLSLAASTLGRRDPPPATSLHLNIPAFRLDVVVDSAIVSTYGVAIGMRRYRTPVGSFAVHRIVWNPWWIPPDSPWAREDTVTPPGPANPMGRVKLLIGGTYYVHGTPIARSVGSAASHGCIRMRNADAIALAMRLQDDAMVGLGAGDIVSVFADTISYAVDLPWPVPVSIGYAVAEVRLDSLLLHPDVYRRLAGGTRAAAMQALLAAGRDTLRVRRSVIGAALRRARTRHVAIALDSLLR